MSGFTAILEAVIAGMILVGGLAFASTQVVSVPPAQDMQAKAISFLRGLDDQGLLRNWTVTKNFPAIENEIIFLAANRTVEICDHNNNCIGRKPAGRNVYAGSYLISGASVFEPYLVKLYFSDVI